MHVLLSTVLGQAVMAKIDASELQATDESSLCDGFIDCPEWWIFPAKPGPDRTHALNPNEKPARAWGSVNFGILAFVA